MIKVVLIFVLLAFVNAHQNGRQGDCQGNRNAAQFPTTTTVRSVNPNDGNGVIQARAQPVSTTESSQIDMGVEIIDLSRN